MSTFAANPAGLPHLSPRAPGGAGEQEPSDVQRRWRTSPLCGGHASSNRAVIAVAFCNQRAHDNFTLARVCRYVSRLCSGTASALFHAPCGSSLFCLAAPPCGLRFPSKSCSGRTPKRFLRSLRKCRASALGSMAHSLYWCPDQDREIQQTETIMYQNKVTLIGFLGSNAEARTNSADFSVTTLSLATKSSYKKDGK